MSAEPLENYRDKVGGTVYSAQFPFKLLEEYGTLKRLYPSGAYLKATVQDDLTQTTRGLVDFILIAKGHLTQN